MKNFLFLLMTIMSLSTFAQKTTPIYGDTVSVIMNLKIGKSILIKDTAITNHAGDALITDAQGKIKTIPFSIASEPNTIYTSDDTIKENRFIAGVDTNSLVFYDFYAFQSLAKDVFMGTFKYHFFANANAVGNEVYDTISAVPCRLVMATDQTHHLTKNGTFYDGVSKYALLQTTKDLVYMKTTNGSDSTSLTLFPDKIKIIGVKDTIPNKLYGKDKNGNLIEYNELSKTINVPATTDTVLISGFGNNIVAPVSTISELYLSLPPTPTDGTRCIIKFSESVTSATFIVTDSSTIKGITNPSPVGKGNTIIFIYDTATTTWY